MIKEGRRPPACPSVLGRQLRGDGVPAGPDHRGAHPAAGLPAGPRATHGNLHVAGGGPGSGPRGEGWGLECVEGEVTPEM